MEFVVEWRDIMMASMLLMIVAVAIAEVICVRRLKKRIETTGINISRLLVKHFNERFVEIESKIEFTTYEDPEIRTPASRPIDDLDVEDAMTSFHVPPVRKDDEGGFNDGLGD